MPPCLQRPVCRRAGFESNAITHLRACVEGDARPGDPLVISGFVVVSVSVFPWVLQGTCCSCGGGARAQGRERGWALSSGGGHE